MGDTFGKSADGLTDPQARNRNLLKLGAAATGGVLSGQPVNMKSLSLSKPSNVRSLKQGPDQISPAPPSPQPDFTVGAPADLPNLYPGQANLSPAFRRPLPFYGY